MQLDIDWSSIDVDAVKGFLDAKRFRGSQFLDHAAEVNPETPKCVIVVLNQSCS